MSSLWQAVTGALGIDDGGASDVADAIDWGTDFDMAAGAADFAAGVGGSLAGDLGGSWGDYYGDLAGIGNEIAGSDIAGSLGDAGGWSDWGAREMWGGGLGLNTGGEGAIAAGVPSFNYTGPLADAGSNAAQYDLNLPAPSTTAPKYSDSGPMMYSA